MSLRFDSHVCNLIFIIIFLEGFECDLNTHHSHGKEGANKRHHQACGAEKEINHMC